MKVPIKGIIERVGCPYEKKKPQIYSHATKNMQSSLLSQLNDFFN